MSGEWGQVDVTAEVKRLAVAYEAELGTTGVDHEMQKAMVEAFCCGVRSAYEDLIAHGVFTGDMKGGA